MSDKAAIESFIVDLKITPEGDVKILELGDFQRSGLSGYKRMTGKDLAQETVYPFIQSLGADLYQNTPIYHPLKDGEKGLLGIVPLDLSQPPTDPADISTYGAVILSLDLSTQMQRQFLEEDCQGRILFSNQNRLAYATYCHKAAFYALAADIEEMGDLLPKQHLYALKGQKVDVGRILEDFDGHSHIVLKQPQNAQALGVDIQSTDGIISRYLAQGAPSMARLKTKFKKRHDSILIAQEVIDGQHLPIVAKDGTVKEYDPVIRVVATAYRTKGKVQIEFHDAYYKIPNSPVNSRDKSKSLISDVKKGPQSPVMDDSIKANIFAQLRSGLVPFYTKVLSTDPVDLVRTWLCSDDAVYRHLATDIATHEIYFDYHQSGLEEYPKDIAATLYARRKEEKRTKTLISVSEGYTCHADEGLQTYIRDRAEQDRIRWKHKFGDWVAKHHNIIQCCNGAFVGAFISYTLLAPDSLDDLTERLTEGYEAFNSQEDFNQAAAALSNLTLFTTDTSDKKAAALQSDVTEQNLEHGLTTCFTHDAVTEDLATHIARSYALKSPAQSFLGIHINGAFNLVSTSCPDMQWPESLTVALSQPAAPEPSFLDSLALWR